ncbi:nucleotidyltransferase domain-containing protein [Fervidicoccus fontis]|uniref:protein adenylyltransferase n=2 Tax=Fervidicoccus fontis TaxID=683846 RepID=I0A1Y8_FERFK|nr:nucleotidyltransferase domain-containing protein [Fervidicoccus fontis]AFH42995.1 putative nucleotidyltransferase [Fervidicoccus fontis Kam940]MBE9391451.1 nucleotidyltransferase domain-containing protein [Fervidicoccus fontis]
MVREKVSKNYDEFYFEYGEKELKILNEKRKKARNIMGILESKNIRSFLHGSVARGDVHSKSDVDIVILQDIPSYVIELTLESFGILPVLKRIVQATPSNSPKAYLILDPEEEVVVSFPLTKLMKREVEFYSFGGIIDYGQLMKNVRVPGVNKKLELIKPIEEGYTKSSIIGREEEIASLLKISIDTILERERVLIRRDEKGRTGVYLNIELYPEDPIEDAVLKASEKNPALKKVLRERGKY